MKAKHKGFTLVELLIVIVVIAILAAITIVSYGKIKDRAYNASVESAASSALKIIQLAYTNQGRIFVDDVQDGDFAICIGNPDDFPANSTFEEHECHTYGGGGWASPHLWSIYSQYASGNLAVGEMYDGSYAHIRGITYLYAPSIADNKSYDYLSYNLIGADQKCSLPGAEPVDDLYDFENGSNETSCFINLDKLIGEPPLDW